MTARFGVPHGQAVSITLAPFLLWNAEAMSGRLSPLLEAMGVDSVEDAAHRIRALLASVGLATRLSSLSLSPKDLDLIVEEGFHTDRSEHNPKPVTPDDALSILQGIY